MDVFFFFFLPQSRGEGNSSYLSDHPVPDSSDQLAVLAVGDQVEVVGELYGSGQFLQDVYAEAFTAQFCVWLRVAYNTEMDREGKTQRDAGILKHLHAFLRDYKLEKLNSETLANSFSNDL